MSSTYCLVSFEVEGTAAVRCKDLETPNKRKLNPKIWDFCEPVRLLWPLVYDPLKERPYRKSDGEQVHNNAEILTFSNDIDKLRIALEKYEKDDKLTLPKDLDKLDDTPLKRNLRRLPERELGPPHLEKETEIVPVQVPSKTSKSKTASVAKKRAHSDDEAAKKKFLKSLTLDQPDPEQLSDAESNDSKKSSDTLILEPTGEFVDLTTNSPLKLKEIKAKTSKPVGKSPSKSKVKSESKSKSTGKVKSPSKSKVKSPSKVKLLETVERSPSKSLKSPSKSKLKSPSKWKVKSPSKSKVKSLKSTASKSQTKSPVKSPKSTPSKTSTPTTPKRRVMKGTISFPLNQQGMVEIGFGETMSPDEFLQVPTDSLKSTVYSLTEKIFSKNELLSSSITGRPSPAHPTKAPKEKLDKDKLKALRNVANQLWPGTKKSAINLLIGKKINIVVKCQKQKAKPVKGETNSDSSDSKSEEEKFDD